MNVEIDIESTDPRDRVFLTWTPVQATARLRNFPAGTPSVGITMRSAGSGGQLVFDTQRTDNGGATLDLNLPGDESPVPFWVAGEFMRPSEALDDAAVEAVASSGAGGVLGTQRATVRVRKNAEGLTAGERDRFLSAFATLNASGAGRFRDFRDMHRNSTSREAHGDNGFLPWHRAYLLDLERELQAIDPSVALPYWRFDQPAPNLFSLRFIGLPNSVGRVQFSSGHPLTSWRTDGPLGINRRMRFPRNGAPPVVLSESDTFDLGGVNDLYPLFAQMEGNPHGQAHVSFRGSISSIDTAARDPLFFMLHANVDRLWSRWQWLKGRMDPGVPGTFQDGSRVGHRAADTMWPWNGVTSAPRPPTAPGGNLAGSPVTAAPGATPTVGAMIDFQGAAGAVPLAFAYDDVPFEL